MHDDSNDLAGREELTPVFFFAPRLRQKSFEGLGDGEHMLIGNRPDVREWMRSKTSKRLVWLATIVLSLLAKISPMTFCLDVAPGFSFSPIKRGNSSPFTNAKKPFSSAFVSVRSLRFHPWSCNSEPTLSTASLSRALPSLATDMAPGLLPGKIY